MENIETEEKEKRKGLGRILRVINNLIYTVILFALIILVGVVVIPRFFGLNIYTILSGSMEPAYNVGDLIYVVPKSFEDIKMDDVITFTRSPGSTAITHRVVDIEEGEKQFYTKGDANNTVDGIPAEYANTIGVVKFAIPKAGAYLKYLNTSAGTIVLVCIVIGGYIFNLLIHVFLKRIAK